MLGKRRRSTTATSGPRGMKKRRLVRRENISVAPTGTYTVGGPRLRTKLKWVWRGSITSTTGTPGTMQFNLGSLYDPNYTGAGDQPVGFDELMAIYQKYHVIAVKWEVDFTAVNATVAANNITIAMAATQAQPSTTIDPDSLWAQPFSRAKTFYVDAGGLNRLSMYVQLAKVLGVPYKEVYESEEYEGTATTSPSRWPYGTIAVQNTDSSTTSIVWCCSRMTFYCEFRKPALLSFS